MTFNPLTDRSAITANKQGIVTGEQRELLRLTSGLTFWFLLGSIIVVVGIVAWVVNKEMANLPKNIPHIPNYFWIALAVGIGTPLLYLGFQLFRSSRTRREIDSGNIVSEEGKIEWTGRRYRVDASVWWLRSVYGPINAMPGRYRFYLLPGSRILLSADPLDPPQTYYTALTNVLGQVLGPTKEDLTKVALVQGPGKKDFRYVTRSTIKSLIINHERFDVSTRAYDALVDGATYRIYYMPKSKRILSVEVVPPTSMP